MLCETPRGLPPPTCSGNVQTLVFFLQGFENKPGTNTHNFCLTSDKILHPFNHPATGTVMLAEKHNHLMNTIKS